ncbi:MAG TPA: TonB-dependent receptor [Patescibacteria group bacterium]|nr:TonB-dependent receptor [Patescibacteria group bacterium]
MIHVLKTAFFLFACTITAAFAQAGTVEGTVKTTGGSAMPGATVTVRGTRLGAVVRTDGTFRISNVPVGNQTVEARSLGYETATRSITIRTNETARVEFSLKESAVSTDEVQVFANRRRQEQTDTRTSVTTVDPRESKYRPGAAEDVMRSLQGLPGVIAANDFSSQLIIRGSGPDQNLIMMDNIELFNPYRLYGFISMFNPETVSDITLITGGFPARYTDRLSAVLDITNREGARDSGYFNGKINASVTNANLVFEGALPFWNSSWIVSTRRTYYDLIAAPLLKSTGAVEGDVALPNFTDLQAKVTLQPHPKHKIYINGITSRDNTELTSGRDREQADSISLRDESFNDVIGATWLWTPSEKFLTTNTISYYKNQGANDFGGSGGSQAIFGDQITQEEYRRLADSLRALGRDVPQLFSVEGGTSFTLQKNSFRTDNTWRYSKMHTIEFGGNFDLITTGVSFNIKLDSAFKALREANPRIPAIPESFGSDTTYFRAGGYIQDNIRLFDKLSFQPGVRFDYFKIIDKAYIAPRISASYAIDDITTIRGAWGVYYQSPGYEKLVDRQVFFDFTSPRIADLRAEKATHSILGIERMLTTEWQIRAEGYYKGFNDLILQEKLRGTSYRVQRIPGRDPKKREGWTPPEAFESDSLTSIPVNNATGEAFGIEFMLQKIQTVGNSPFYGWLSYSLAWANRYRDNITIPFNFDRRHNLNLVGGWKVNSWLELNTTWTYGSGFPWTRAVGLRPRVIEVVNQETGQREPRLETDFRGNVIFDVDRGGDENINRHRLPDYHRLDIRATTYANWFDLDWSIYLDVINVYNRKNVISENYRINRETLALEMREIYMLPILPTLGFSVKF